MMIAEKSGGTGRFREQRRQSKCGLALERLGGCVGLHHKPRMCLLSVAQHELLNPFRQHEQRLQFPYIDTVGRSYGIAMAFATSITRMW
jgi:hypothetical protein